MKRGRNLGVLESMERYVAPPAENDLSARGAGQETTADNTEGEPILGLPEGLADVTLVVEGRGLRVNRTVMAHYSPFFHKLFFSDFKEKNQTSIPLPDERYLDMVTFLNILFPRTPAAKRLVTDRNLLRLLTMADKYDTKAVLVRCQDYIGNQLGQYYFNFYRYYTKAVYREAPAKPVPSKTSAQPRRGDIFVKEVRPQPFCYETSLSRSMTLTHKVHTCHYGSASNARADIYEAAPTTQLRVRKDDTSAQRLDREELVDKLSLYMKACDDYNLPKYRKKVQSLLLGFCHGMADLEAAQHYAFLSPTVRVELLESMCRRLGSRDQNNRPDSDQYSGSESDQGDHM